MDPFLRARPLLVIALALAAGDAAGAALAASAGGPPGAGAWLVVAAAVPGPLALLRWRRDRGRSEGWRPGRWHGPVLAILLSVVTFARAAGAGSADQESRATAPWAPAVGTVVGGDLRATRARGDDAGDGSWSLPPGVARAGDGVLRLGPGTVWRRAASEPRTARAAPVDRVELALEDVRLCPRGARAEGGPLERVRDTVRARLSGLEDEQARGLAIALATGDRSALPAALADLFTRTGTRHLLALSGLHVGLLALFAALPLARVAGRLGRRLPFGPVYLSAAIQAVVGGCLLLACVPLGGAAAPVRRAALAGALAQLAPVLPAAGVRQGLGRRVDGPSLWAFALLAEVLARPGATAAIDVQQSYAATLGLLVVLPRWIARRRRTATGPSVVREGVAAAWLGTAARRLAGSFRTALLASTVAVVVTAPCTWARFGELAPCGVLATPLALAPLTALFGSAVAFAAAPEWMPEALPRACAGALVGLLRCADALPGSPLPVPPRPVWALLSVAALAAWWLASGVRPAKRAAAAALGLLLLPWQVAPPALEVVACDVGHGTAVALRAPGAGTWLFDAGSRDRTGVATAVGALLRRWDVGRLTIVASHADRDHVGALPWLTERWPSARLLGAGAVEDLATGRARVGGSAGLSLDLVRGAPCTGNEGSRALRAEWCGRRVWLFGDAEEEGLAHALLSTEWLTEPEGADLLLLPHHGRRGAWTAELLERVRPTLAWASCSGAPEAEQVLRTAGVPLESTDRSGALRRLFTPRFPSHRRRPRLAGG